MKKFNSMALVLVLASLASCATHKAEKKVETEIKAVVIEKNVTVAQTAREFILKSDKLDEAKKKQLLELQDKTLAKGNALKEELEKTRMVLVQTVLAPKMSNKEFSILKKKIAKLEKERMENGFKAMTEARNIIDPKKNIENQEFYRAYLHNHLQEL